MTIYTFVISVQHSFGGPSHGNQRIKVNKRSPNWEKKEKRVKLSVFADNLIPYKENFKNFTRKLLELINEFGNAAIYN